MPKKEKNLYDKVKGVQEDFYEIARSLGFIKVALENDGPGEFESSYNLHLVADMIQGLRGFVENSGKELFLEFGIKEPEEEELNA